MARAPIAVIDVGSNSARVVVFRRESGGVLDVVADEHISLQLIRALGKDRKFPKAAVERTLRVLRDFRQVAEAAGATKMIALGTAALREAKNGTELRERAAAECGVRIEIMAAGAEARAGFLGAVYGLPVSEGIVFDIGGGSLQISHFRHRRLARAVSLPLGALRVSDDFLTSDPPSAGQVRKLRAHVARLLSDAGVPRLRKGEVVVGTGGTVRNLAKLDSRRWEYPIPRLHGYDLSRRRLRELTGILLSRTAAARTSLSGLNAKRADSIVGGAIVAECVLEATRSTNFLVAGQGLREGIVLESLLEKLPRIERVRERSVAALTSRFATCNTARAARRAAIALSLYDALEPYPEPLMREMLTHAAGLLDVGRSVDYYRRHAHTAAILRASGPMGFSHREIALLSSIIELADEDGWDPKRASPPLHEDDFDPLERAGVMLCLSDVIEERRLPGRARALSCLVHGRFFVVEEPALEAWDDPELAERFREAFGKELKTQRSE